MSLRARRVLPLGWLLIAGAVAAAEPDPDSDPELTPIPEDIRERLTEREDENRLEEPYTTFVFERELQISGQYELQIEGIDPVQTGGFPDGDHRLLLEQEIEAELLYTLAPRWFVFVQGRLVHEHDLLPETRNDVSDLFLERGEAWIALEGLLGGDFGIEVGRLDFEDDRTWWWDTELDAARISADHGRWGAEVSLAQELFATRSDDDFVEPEQQGVLRVLAELSYEIGEQHGVELFALFEDDHSRAGSPGQTIRDDREDELDGTLFWLGPRAIGGFDLGSLGTLGYWLDAASVFGRETRIDYDDPVGGRREILATRRRDVLGWGFDLGATWFLEAALEPRFTASYALGTGDGSPRSGNDTAFRQTGLQGNETGFGGVRRFSHYGRLLDPELSNLGILTLGAGLSLLRSSSIQLVYQHYRLLERATELREARLEADLDGRHRHLGDAFDLVLAIEEGPRFELELSGSAFRAGSAFGPDRGHWAWGGLVAFRVAF